MKCRFPHYYLWITLAVSSCAVQIQSKKINTISNRHRNHEGVIYHLPKNVINTTVTYTKIDSVLILNGKEIKVASSTVVIEKPIELSTSLIADTISFQIKNDKALRGLFKDSDVNLEITPNGLLKTLRVESQDNSSAILKSGLKYGVDGLLGVGSLLTGLPLNLIPNPFKVTDPNNLLTLNPELESFIMLHSTSQKSLANKKGLKKSDSLFILFSDIYDLKSQFIQNLNKQLDTLSGRVILAKTKEEVNVLEKQIQLLKEQIAYQNQMNRFDVKKEYIIVRETIDPYANHNLKDTVSHTLKKPIISGIQPVSIPEVTLSIPFDTLNFKAQTQSSNYLNNKGCFNGFLVRTADYVDINIRINDNENATKTLLLSQAGDLTVIPFKNKVLGKSNLQMELYDETGTLKRYGATTKGGGENALNALNNSNAGLLDDLDLASLLDQLGLEGVLDLLNGQLDQLGNLELSGQLKELELRKQMAILEKQIQGINNGTIDPNSLSNDELQKKVSELERLLRSIK